MKIIGLDHIGIAVKSFEEGSKFYKDILKLDLSDKYELPAQKIRISYIALSGTKIEFLEPTDKESPIARFLEKRGEGIHHLCFLVEDIEKALEELRSQGIKLIDHKPRTNPHGEKIAFIHPKSAGGVLLELKERPV